MHISMVDDSEFGQLRRALRSTPLLGNLGEPVLNRIAAISKIVELPEDFDVCEQGDPAGELFIVLDGQLAGVSRAANGSVAVVDVIRGGETLGLATVLAGVPHFLGLRTVTASRLLAVDADGLLTLVEQEPSVVAALHRAGANEFHALVRQVCDLKLRTTSQRLGCYLLSLPTIERDNTTALRLPFDKRLLAARLGCRQENLSRAFAALREFGVETHGARVILHDIAGLRAYAEPDDPLPGHQQGAPDSSRKIDLQQPNHSKREATNSLSIAYNPGGKQSTVRQREERARVNVSKRRAGDRTKPVLQPEA